MQIICAGREIFKYSNTKDSNTETFKFRALRALRGEQNKLNAAHVPHKGRNPELFFRFS